MHPLGCSPRLYSRGSLLASPLRGPAHNLSLPPLPFSGPAPSGNAHLARWLLPYKGNDFEVGGAPCGPARGGVEQGYLPRFILCSLLSGRC